MFARVLAIQQLVSLQNIRCKPLTNIFFKVIEAFCAFPGSLDILHRLPVVHVRFSCMPRPKKVQHSRRVSKYFVCMRPCAQKGSNIVLLWYP